MSVKDLIKNEIDNLPENLLDEVFDFIKASQELSKASFEKVWDNEESGC